MQGRENTPSSILIAINQAKYTIPFLVSYYNPSKHVWDEEHTNKTVHWYANIGTKYREMAESHPKRMSPISLDAEWRFGEAEVAKLMHGIKVSATAREHAR